MEEVQYHRGATAHNNLRGTSPQVIGYTSPPVIPVIPVIPQGSHYGSSYQSRPTLSHQSASSTVYPDVTHHPPPSSRQRVPRSQSSGSHRGSDHDPYNNPNSIERWARGVTPGNSQTASSVGSNGQRNGSTSHRSDKTRDRDRRRDEGGSRRGSTHRDYGSDAGSRADGRTSRLNPNPNVIRKESSSRGPPSHCSRDPSVTRRR